jgi:hypothetical protein
MTAPILSYATTAGAALASLTLTGTGAGGAVVAGTTSSAAALRDYNNQGGGSTVSDAFNCVLTTYDSSSVQGGQASAPVSGLWLQVQVLDYDGTTTGADTGFSAIGGTSKHALPVNGGHLGGGTGGHYATLQLQVVVPSTATSLSYTPALWTEYSYL